MTALQATSADELAGIRVTAGPPPARQQFGGLRHSNMAGTKGSVCRHAMTTAEVAAMDIRDVLEPIGKAKLTDRIARGLVNNMHRTWVNGVDGLHQWKLQSHTEWADYLQKVGLTVGDVGKLSREIDKHREARAPPTAPPDKVVAYVRIISRTVDVQLKLTLTAKLLARPFCDALMVPFLKAFSKKQAAETTVEDVAGVEVDDEPLTDLATECTKIFKSEESWVLLRLKEAPEAAPEAAPVVAPVAAPVVASEAAARGGGESASDDDDDVASGDDVHHELDSVD